MRLAFVLSGLMALAAPASAGDIRGPGSLLITEIMIDPGKVLDSVGEWVELLNPGAEAVSLAGIALESRGSKAVERFVLPGCEACILPPDGLFVLGKSVDATRNGGWIAARSLAWSGISLSNADDYVRLVDSEGETIVQLDWGAKVPTGRSLVLSGNAGMLPLLDAGAGWEAEGGATYGAGDYGSPGIANRASYTVGGLPSRVEPGSVGQPAQVPEPPTWAMLVAGLLAITAVARRRRGDGEPRAGIA